MKHPILQEMLALTLRELENNPDKFLQLMKDDLPELDVVDGYAYIDVPAYENGQYGTRKVKFHLILMPSSSLVMRGMQILPGNHRTDFLKVGPWKTQVKVHPWKGS